MEETCSCGSKTYTTKPAKFSLDDKWGKWRRLYKEQQAL
jgi:rRNA maturation protein Nop10